MGKISFGDMPEPIKEHVKDYFAYIWLVEGLGNSHIRGVMTTLRLMVDILRARHGSVPSPLMLTREDAQAIEEHVAALAQTRGRAPVAVIARFAAFLREHHDGQPSDFKPDPANVPPDRWLRRTYTEGLERLIPDEVSAALMEAMSLHVSICEEQGRRGVHVSLADRLYPSIIPLMMGSGRRISEILLLRRHPLREPDDDELLETGPGVWLCYVDTKRGEGKREAFIGEPMAGVVRDAVRHALAATVELTECMDLDRLFITDSAGGGKRGTVHTVSAAAFSLWLNGRTADDGSVERPGFIHRYCITYRDGYYPIDPHQARHTLAHKAYIGGASHHDVGDHLGHKRVSVGLNPMTNVYIHGEQRQVEQIRAMHTRRGLFGKALPVINGRDARVEGLRAEDVHIWREQGLVVQPTHYGH